MFAFRQEHPLVAPGFVKDSWREKRPALPPELCLWWQGWLCIITDSREALLWLFRLYRAGQSVALQAGAIKLCRFFWTDHYRRFPLQMRLKHNLDGFIHRKALDCAQQRVHNEIHRVDIIVMQQHAIPGEQAQ